jgi:hypothetical protein
MRKGPESLPDLPQHRHNDYVMRRAARSRRDRAFLRTDLKVAAGP